MTIKQQALPIPAPATTGVRLSDPNNSTTFTVCCGLAVHDEGKCPGCGAEILPKGAQARFDSAFNPWLKIDL